MSSLGHLLLLILFETNEDKAGELTRSFRRKSILSLIGAAPDHSGLANLIFPFQLSTGK